MGRKSYEEIGHPFPNRRNINMQFTYKKATIQDIDILVETRIEVLRAANKLDATVDMKEVEKQSFEYYKSMAERVVLLRELAIKQMKTMELLNVSALPGLPKGE